MSEEKLPTEEQLLGLSRRGLVAFAARCLRRVQTLPRYREALQDIQETIEALWQFPEDFSDKPDTAHHRAQIEQRWNRVSSPLVVLVCETALQALSEAGGNAPRWAHDVAVATHQAALEQGHDVSDLIRSDFQVLSEVAPGPFPEMGGPFDGAGLEILSRLWPDGDEPPWSRRA